MELSDHEFGSHWTDKKLNCIRDYAIAWTQIMNTEKVKKFGWRTRYIDAFSGTGTYRPTKRDSAVAAPLFDELQETTEDRGELRKGSATLAIEAHPPFQRIDLIEAKQSHADQLRALAAGDLNRRVFVHEKDANAALRSLAETLGNKDRALVFIDPYGCEVEWDTLVAIANTRVCDVWYLFPTMGINRQLERTAASIPEYKKDALNRVLGTSEWEKAFYEDRVTYDLFGQQRDTNRKAGPTRVEAFFMDRLRSIFPAVHDSCLQLKNGRNGHLFSLCFAVSSHSERAQRLAIDRAKATIRQWSGK